MKVKRILAGIFIIPIIVLTGCGKSPEKTAPSKEPAPSEITSAIMAEINIPSAVEKDKTNITAYYDIDPEQAEAVSVYICASGAYPDELAVFKMNSEEQAGSAKDIVKKHYDSQVELYKDYTPKEMYKLNEAEIIVKGKYVMMFVCENNSRAKEIAEGLF